MNFTITDLTENRGISESFLDKTISIESHSGLHPTEKALINNLSSITLGKKLLIAGNRADAITMITTTMRPDSKTTCHIQDIHHAKILCRNLKNNNFNVDFVCDDFVTLEQPEDESEPNDESPTITVACTTQIEGGEFDNALFVITPTTTTGELSLDLLENIHRVLKMQGKCLIAYDGESHALTSQLKGVFGQVQTLKQSRKKGTLFLATKKNDLKKPRNFSASFETSLPGLEKISLESLPGVFCHRRPDSGGLALAEIAAPLLQSKMRVLDMGCGCGIVGILLAQKQPDIELTVIDSNIRALDATNRNITALNMPSAELILSDNGTSQTGYDLFIGNPPYYSNYRIAEVFIDQAYHSLKEGGTLLIVTKQTNKVGDLIYERFGTGDITPRRGYSVISAVR